MSGRWVAVVILVVELVQACNGCLEKERLGLLEVKRFFGGHKFSMDSLPTWSGPSCCEWDGVQCEPMTAHLLRLSLSSLLDIDDSVHTLYFFDASLVKPFTKLEALDLSYNGFSGFKPKFLNLKTFGCLCFSYVPQVKRDKLDKKSEAGIFVGYSSTTKAYRIFLPSHNKIIISRDVKFFELEKWSKENEKQPDIQNQSDDEDVDDQPIRGTRPLSEIYQRCNVAVMEPGDYKEAANDEKWIVAMKEELNMIEINQTWELVDRPKDKKAIGVKWVYRTKLNSDGSINKHKARLVVKGYAQMFGVDYSETFAPVARLDTIRLLLALAAQKGWTIYQMDVMSAFLNGYLEEEIYVEQPEGFLVQGQEEKVYRLKKALYGLKQAPRSWYSRINAHLISLGFEKSLSGFRLYMKKVDNEILVVCLYVDDLLITGSTRELIDEFKEKNERCLCND